MVQIQKQLNNNHYKLLATYISDVVACISSQMTGEPVSSDIYFSALCFRHFFDSLLLEYLEYQNDASLVTLDESSPHFPRRSLRALHQRLCATRGAELFMQDSVLVVDVLPNDQQSVDLGIIASNLEADNYESKQQYAVAALSVFARAMVRYPQSSKEHKVRDRDCRVMHDLMLKFRCS